MAKKKTSPKKKSAKKKATKKTSTISSRETGQTKKKRKLQLKNVYIVEETPSGNLVHKNPREGEEEEVYLVDKDGVCDCKASEFGASCKHVAMADGTLEIDDHVSLDRAEQVLDDYLDRVVRSEWPRARIVNLVGYKKQPFVGNASALAYGVLSDRSADRLTLWTMSEGLPLRIHCFKDLHRYKRALSLVRKRTQKQVVPAQPSDDQYVEGPDTKQSVDVSAVGQTYGTQHEGE